MKFSLFLKVSVVGLSIAACFLVSAKQGKSGASTSGSVPGTSMQKPELLFERYFPNPTGRNGMEEYLTAADRISSSSFRELQRWESGKNALSRSIEIGDDEKAWLSRSSFGDPEKTSLVTARRIVTNQLVGVRELVQAGNSKLIESLHPKSDLFTSFPELAQMKSVARYFALEAYVAFADGNSASGTDALLTALKMLNRLPQDNFICHLVTIATNAIVLAEFEKHLDQLSVRDVARVSAALRDIKTWETGLIDAIHGEMQTEEESFKQMALGVRKEDLTTFALPGWEKYFASYTHSDWQAFAAASQDRFSARMQVALEVLKRPEDRWFSEFKLQGWKDVEADETLPKTVLEAAQKYADFSANMVSQIATAEARFRTQLRLLQIHMLVLAYKWKEGRLPDRLDLLADTKDLRDSFGSGDIQYIPDPFGHYQLFSKGFNGSGRIDLRWRIDPNAPKVDPGDIPPAGNRP